MANIELFDKYINGELSDSERNEFKGRLESDKEFATDFNIYMVSVIGICKEAEQDNMDFGVAMKKLSKEQLRNIIGESKKAPVIKPKKLLIKSWIWQAASIAAVVVIAFTVVFKIQKESRNALYDVIYASAQFEDSYTRGANEIIDITKLTDSELKVKLSEMEQIYHNSQDIDERYLSGYPLAMAYIRLHEPQSALVILEDLVSELQHDEYYEPQVREMRLIINLLK